MESHGTRLESQPLQTVQPSTANTKCPTASRPGQIGVTAAQTDSANRLQQCPNTQLPTPNTQPHSTSQPQKQTPTRWTKANDTTYTIYTIAVEFCKARYRCMFPMFHCVSLCFIYDFCRFQSTLVREFAHHRFMTGSKHTHLEFASSARL
jgi:hypothetical protein